MCTVKIWNERSQIEHLFGWFPRYLKDKDFGTAFATEEEKKNILHRLETMNPNTVSREVLEEAIKPFAISWYVFKNVCESCETQTWNMIRVNEHMVCENCVSSFIKELNEKP
jgi:hypothetical protein